MNLEFYDKHHESHVPHRVTLLAHGEKRGAIINLLSSYHTEENETLIVGCGRGQDTEVVKKKCVATDLSSVALLKAAHSYPQHLYVTADGFLHPFKNKSFKVIICSEVIEHVVNPEKLLREFRRILITRGVLVITTPNWVSLYGLARIIGEKVTGHPITSAGSQLITGIQKKH